MSGATLEDSSGSVSDYEPDSDFLPEDANIDDADDDEEEQDQGGPPTLQSNSVSSAKRKQPDVDSDDAPPQRSAVRIKKTKRTVKFVMGWLTKKAYKDWLVFDVGTNRMFCSFCKKHDKEGVWATCGTDNFRYFYVNNYMKKKTILLYVILHKEVY